MNEKLSAELDEAAEWEWEMKSLACARCGHHWQGAYSFLYVKFNPFSKLIWCPQCNSVLGVHPSSN